MQCLKLSSFVHSQSSHLLRVRPLLTQTASLHHHVLQRGSIPAFRRYSVLQKFKIFSSSRDTLRWNSTTAQLTSTTVSSLPEGYIPEPPVAAVLPDGVGDSTQELLQQLTALGEPTLSSLGLGGMWPSGWVQTALEFLHVTFDVPWWTAIVIGTLILRTCVFPLVIIAQRNVAKTQNHQPIVEKLQAKYTNSRMSGNPLEGARAGQELMMYMKKHDVSPFKNMLMPFVQAPIFLSVFLGIRQMANLPVESMTTGGIFWFLDLTVPDPFYTLPVLAMATLLLTLEIGVDGVRAANMPKTMRIAMRVMPFAMIPFIINFPTGMLCYWLTSNLFSLVQVLFLRIKSVKKYFKIPEFVVHDQSVIKEKQGFVKAFKENWRNQKMQTAMENRLKDEARRFEDAGVGAIPKTYAYDPTKAKKNKK